MIMMAWVSVTSPIKITERLNHSESNFDLCKYEYRNALLWLFVMYIDKLLVDVNEIKRNVIIYT